MHSWHIMCSIHYLFILVNCKVIFVKHRFKCIWYINIYTYTRLLKDNKTNVKFPFTFLILLSIFILIHYIYFTLSNTLFCHIAMCIDTQTISNRRSKFYTHLVFKFHLKQNRFMKIRYFLTHVLACYCKQQLYNCVNFQQYNIKNMNLNLCSF